MVCMTSLPGKHLRSVIFQAGETRTDGANVVIERLTRALSEYEPDFGLVQLLPGVDIDAGGLIEAARANARRLAAFSQWNERLAMR